MARTCASGATLSRASACMFPSAVYIAVCTGGGAVLLCSVFGLAISFFCTREILYLRLTWERLEWRW